MINFFFIITVIFETKSTYDSISAISCLLVSLTLLHPLVELDFLDDLRPKDIFLCFNKLIIKFEEINYLY